ncbi:hypothetical protein CSA17_03885 [bacterium DOLJORAL78_65_58]|nr:MAG: hypothetical protein CSB20_12125 [bacterium DOLZORAL124_64_63]PIE76120.1 MAG: hypothetical protein CSA17_03885 [bacterium DOLJORAL78_65_58]
MGNRPVVDLSVLESFRAHVLRWNRQINLVSRQATRDRLDSLLGQCAGGHQVLVSWLRDVGLGDGGLGDGKRSLWYFDLGSGGGLPGVVWHRLWVAQGGDPCTHLVEPREKRAWFLERAQGPEDGNGFGVLMGRWGEVPVVAADWPPGSPLVVISLKALHLDDDEVLHGWEQTHEGRVGEADLVIARYYPPEQVLDAPLVEKLGLEPAGGVRQRGDYIYRGLGVAVRPVFWQGQSVASLVLSAYCSARKS